METTPLLSHDNNNIPKPRGALIASRRWITVEPVIMAASFAYGILLVDQSQYIHNYFTEIYNTSSANHSQCQAGTSQEAVEIDNNIQTDTTRWNIYVTIFNSLGSIPMGFILGSYSDQIGRKIPLGIAVTGMFLCAMFNFFTIQFQLPLYFLLIGMGILGLSGGFMLIVSVSVSYIADITTEKNRMIRIITLDVLLFLTIGVPQIAIGFFIKKYGYALPFVLVASVTLLVLLYIVIPGCLHETVQRNVRGSTSPVKTVLRDAMRVLKVKENKRQIKMILYLCVAFAMDGLGAGSFAVTVLYGMGSPLCMMPENVGVFVFAALMSAGVGSMAAGAVLPICLGSFGMMYISFISTLLSFIGIALARTDLYMIIGTCIGAFRLLSLPIIRTELSKMVNADEQGTLFSIFGIISNLAELLFPVSLQAIYVSTLNFNSQFVFYLCAGLVSIPWIITIALQCISRNRGHVLSVRGDGDLQG